MHKETIMIMINEMRDLDAQLDLLTTIEVLTTDEETIAYCEEIRHELITAPAGLGDLV